MTSNVRAGIDRRHFLQRAGAATATAVIAGSPLRRSAAADSGVSLSPGTPDGLASVARLEALPGKKPLIKLSYRPPNYETPLQYFNDVLTPNDAFFVRYHLSNIP